MKAIITKIDPISNSKFSVEVIVNDNHGNLLFSGRVAFNSVFSDTSKALDDIKESIKNRANQYIAEQASVAKQEAEKLIGKEFDLGD